MKRRNNYRNVERPRLFIIGDINKLHLRPEWKLAAKRESNRAVRANVLGSAAFWAVASKLRVAHYRVDAITRAIISVEVEKQVVRGM